MGMLAWVMMGLAIWHYAIFLPDRFWGGIVGAFVGAILGSIVFGMVIYAARQGSSRSPDAAIPTDNRPLCGPRSADGLAATYFEGIRRETVFDEE